ncbi:MAG: hypothetical protein ABI718_10310 [Acidobacteriota bacterium]
MTAELSESIASRAPAVRPMRAPAANDDEDFDREQEFASTPPRGAGKRTAGDGDDEEEEHENEDGEEQVLDFGGDEEEEDY